MTIASRLLSVSTPPTNPPSGRIPFTTPIPANQILDINSDSIANQILIGTSSTGPANPGSITAGDGAVLRVAQASDPQVHITTTANYGPNLFAPYNPIRIPSDAAGAHQSDHWLVVDDPSRTDNGAGPGGLRFMLWQYRHDTTYGAKCSWGAVYALGSNGETTSLVSLAGSGNGAGLPFTAGLIRRQEAVGLAIPHALQFAARPDRSSSKWRYPANKTDGTINPVTSSLILIEQGSRVQMDPLLNPSDYPAMSGFELAIMICLQTYGAYCTDRNSLSAPSLAFAMQDGDPSDPTLTGVSAASIYGEPGRPFRSGGVYRNNPPGIPNEYYNLPDIPWRYLSGPNTGKPTVRVLASWDGS